MYPWRADRYLRKGPFPLWGFFECFSELKQGECLVITKLFAESVRFNSQKFAVKYERFHDTYKKKYDRFYKYKDLNDVRNQALQLNSQLFRHVTFLGLLFW